MLLQKQVGHNAGCMGHQLANGNVPGGFRRIKVAADSIIKGQLPLLQPLQCQNGCPHDLCAGSHVEPGLQVGLRAIRQGNATHRFHRKKLVTTAYRRYPAGETAIANAFLQQSVDLLLHHLPASFRNKHTGRMIMASVLFMIPLSTRLRNCFFRSQKAYRSHCAYQRSISHRFFGCKRTLYCEASGFVKFTLIAFSVLVQVEMPYIAK